jgi:hypothetical protein
VQRARLRQSAATCRAEAAEWRTYLLATAKQFERYASQSSLNDAELAAVVLEIGRKEAARLGFITLCPEADRLQSLETLTRMRRHTSAMIERLVRQQTGGNVVALRSRS